MRKTMTLVAATALTLATGLMAAANAEDYGPFKIREATASKC